VPGPTGPPGADGSQGAGVTDGSNAAAGAIGEYFEQTFTSVAVAANTVVSVVSLSLGAGDWRVWGNILYTNTASMTGVAAGTIRVQLMTGAAVTPAAPYESVYSYSSASQAAMPAAFTNGVPVPTRRFSSASAMMVYFVCQAAAAGTASGFIAAERRR